MNFKNKLAITKTPLRISFSGGGTDMPYFYEKYGGLTVSTSINKFIYVTVKLHKNFREKYRLNYSDTEITNNLNNIKNLRIKETLKYFKINDPIYINTISDIPYNTGLGSSSSFLVGLINAIFRLKKKKISKSKLAEVAFKIENKITNKSLGKQDHYISSFGGMKVILYKKNIIKVKNLKISKKNKLFLQNNILFFYTGKTRASHQNLKKQKKNLKKNISKLLDLKDLTENIIEEFQKTNINIKRVGEILDKSWQLKKKFTNEISNTFLDKIYKKAIKSGCYGGKLLGAGGGGFFLFICHKKNHKKVEKSLKNCEKILFNLTDKSSNIIFSD